MECVFVLDIFNDAVVHAIKGERARYEPVHKHSRIVDSSDPLRVLEQVRPKKVYVADLNRLMGPGDNLKALEAISLQVETMADVGIAQEKDLSFLPEKAVPVLGTETASLKLMKTIASQRPAIVSIDMKARQIITRDTHLAMDPLDVLLQLNGLPMEAIILLELDRVGTSSGIDEAFLAEAVSASSHPLILGGGVKGVKDLEVLDRLGFEGALVATAVHNRSIPMGMLR